MEIPGLRTPKGLAEMIDREAFQEMCERFCELYGVGLHIIDIEGANLTDIRANTVEFYDYLLSIHRLKVLYMQLIGELKSVELESSMEMSEIQSFNGLYYGVFPILHEGSESGRIIFGPYRSPKSNGLPTDLKSSLEGSEAEHCSL